MNMNNFLVLAILALSHSVEAGHKLRLPRHVYKIEDTPVSSNRTSESSLVHSIAKRAVSSARMINAIDSESRSMGLARIFIKEVGVTYSGNELDSTTLDKPSCRKSCKANLGCVGYTINTQMLLNNCTLYSNLIGGSKANIYAESYKLSLYNTPLLNTNVYVADYSLDYPYNDMSFLKIPFYECAAACNALPNCVAFVLRLDSDDGCWMKSTLAGQVTKIQRLTYKKVVTLPAISASYGQDIYPTRVYVVDTGYDYYGNDINYFTGSVNECQYQCDLTDECISLSMNMDGSGCWLKNGFSDRRANKNRVSFRLLV